MTTLAEMTTEQRAQCKGMWCEITWGGAGKTDLGVLLYLGVCRYHGDEVGCLWVPSIVDGDVYPLANQISLNTLTPRTDLPRAWQPDGSPVSGKWEIDADSDLEVVARTSAPSAYRRWIGEWEEA